MKTPKRVGIIVCIFVYNNATVKHYPIGSLERNKHRRDVDELLRNNGDLELDHGRRGHSRPDLQNVRARRNPVQIVHAVFAGERGLRSYIGLWRPQRHRDAWRRRDASPRIAMVESTANGLSIRW